MDCSCFTVLAGLPERMFIKLVAEKAVAIEIDASDRETRAFVSEVQNHLFGELLDELYRRGYLTLLAS